MKWDRGSGWQLMHECPFFNFCATLAQGRRGKGEAGIEGLGEGGGRNVMDAAGGKGGREGGQR